MAINDDLLINNDYALIIRFHQTRIMITKVRNRELSKHGITATQAAVLFFIKFLNTTEGKATPGRLSRWLLREPHTVSRILVRMEKGGLINRIRGQGKKNQINLALTPKGEQVYNKCQEGNSFGEILSCLSEEERNQLSSSLGKMREKALQKLNSVNKLHFL
jgi:DNA-binding MarR family transcriptional regulator